MISTTHAISTFGLILTLSFVPISTATASPADPPDKSATDATSTAAQDDDDPAAITLAEPDFRVVNLPTTLRLPFGKGNFDLTHRFAGNLRRGTFGHVASTFFGIDEGATVGFEYRFGLLPRVEAVVYRVQFEKTVQFSGQFDLLHQHGGVPLSIAPIVSVEGTDNFQERYAPAVGVSISRRIGEVAALYAVPMWVNNTEAVLAIDNSTFFVGVGGRVRIRPTVYVVGEVTPRLSGYAPGKPQFGFGIEKRAGGHMFQLNLTNSPSTTFAQIARGGIPQSLSLGFNLSRKFF